MNDLGDDVNVNLPDFQEEEDFVAAFSAARDERASIEIFQNMLQDAPVVSVRALHSLAASCLVEGQIRPDVVRLLLEHEPAIARHRDCSMNPLLHKACFVDAPVELIELIIDAYPDGVSKKKGEGCLPLHVACERGVSVETFKLLLSRFPDAATISADTWQGDLPLHECLANRKPIEIILALVEACPEAVSLRNMLGEVALHVACFLKSSLEIVQQLVQEYPEGVFVQDDDGMIPLHDACMKSDSSLEVVEFLIEKHPEGVRSQDVTLRLPLHCAAETGAPLEVVHYLVEEYGDAVTVKDEDGNLPLHKVCSSGASHGVVRMLLDRYNAEECRHSGLSIANDDGRLPLHCYSVNAVGIGAVTLQHLMEIYPEAVHVCDRRGMLPLHGACSSTRLVLDKVRLLVEADLYSIVQKTQNGETPYQLACGVRDRDADVERYLVEMQNEAISDLKEAVEDAAGKQLGLPDLVVAMVWSFVKCLTKMNRWGVVIGRERVVFVRCLKSSSY